MALHRQRFALWFTAALYAFSLFAPVCALRSRLSIGSGAVRSAEAFCACLMCRGGENCCCRHAKTPLERATLAASCERSEEKLSPFLKAVCLLTPRPLLWIAPTPYRPSQSPEIFAALWKPSPLELPPIL